MSEVITIRVQKGTKKLLKGAGLKLSEEVREYIEARAKSLKLHELLPKLHKKAKRIKVGGDSVGVIREYRDYR